METAREMYRLLSLRVGLRDGQDWGVYPQKSCIRVLKNMKLDVSIPVLGADFKGKEL